jgi:hypothetical protein
VSFCQPPEELNGHSVQFHSGTEWPVQFQQLCVDMAVKDQMSPGHWAVNSVILRIYILHEIERRMTSAQMLTMFKSMTVYLGTTTLHPEGRTPSG